jgi:hypothetical protein
MATARAWDRLIRLALVCAAVGVAVAPARARAEYAEIGATPVVVRVTRAPRARTAPRAPGIARAHRCRPARALAVVVPRTPQLPAPRFYLTHRALLL